MGHHVKHPANRPSHPGEIDLTDHQPDDNSQFGVVFAGRPANVSNVEEHDDTGDRHGHVDALPPPMPKVRL